MRDVIIIIKNNLCRLNMHSNSFTDYWISAYYTSFPCRQCSSPADSEGYEEVFHVTPPEAQQCLSLKYTHLEHVEVEHVEVVNGKSDCHCTSIAILQMQHER